MWLSWHQRLGDFIVVIPIVNLIVGVLARRRQAEATLMLLMRVVLVGFVADNPRHRQTIMRPDTCSGRRRVTPAARQPP